MGADTPAADGAVSSPDSSRSRSARRPAIRTMASIGVCGIPDPVWRSHPTRQMPRVRDPEVNHRIAGIPHGRNHTDQRHPTVVEWPTKHDEPDIPFVRETLETNRSRETCEAVLGSFRRACSCGFGGVATWGPRAGTRAGRLIKDGTPRQNGPGSLRPQRCKGPSSEDRGSVESPQPPTGLRHTRCRQRRLGQCDAGFNIRCTHRDKPSQHEFVCITTLGCMAGFRGHSRLGRGLVDHAPGAVVIGFQGSLCTDGSGSRQAARRDFGRHAAHG